MKKIVTFLFVFLVVLSCASKKSFQHFFNTHKKDLGVTAFQVPNFLRGIVRNLSPEFGGVFNNLNDLKFITFNELSKAKQTQLISEIDLVTTTNFTDILRKNTLEKTKIISVKEEGEVVTQAIIFNSTLAKTSVFYLKGRFDPNKLKQLSEANQFEDLSTKLLQEYQSSFTNPSFNPTN